MWRRCGIFPAAGSNFHILFEQIPYLRVDGLLPLRPVRDLQAIDIVQHPNVEIQLTGSTFSELRRRLAADNTI